MFPLIAQHHENDLSLPQLPFPAVEVTQGKLQQQCLAHAMVSSISSVTPFPPHWKTKAEAAESGITEIRGFQLYRQNEEFCLFFVNECHVYFSVLFCICYLWERDGRFMALVNLFDSFTVRRFLTVFWWPWLEIPKGKQPKLTELIILIRIFFF